MLLHTHLVEILRLVKAAAHGVACKAHTHEAGHGTGRVASRSFHGIGSGGGHTAAHHEGILAVCHGILHLLDLLHILRVQGNRIQCDLGNRDTAVYPLRLQSFVHGLFQLIGLGRNLCGAQLQLRQRAKCRLQGRYELGFQLLVDDVAGVSLLHIAANSGIEQQRIGNGVGINTVAADIHRAAHAQILVHDLKDDGAGSAELIAHDFLGVEIVHSLILAGITAVSKALTDSLEGLFQAVAQLARENRGFCGGIVCILTGFGADLYHLTLLHDDHALTVSNGNAGTVGNHIIAALGVGAAGRGTLLSLHYQSIHIQCVAIEKFLPLICQYAA